jgi:hypothetical protein
MKTTSTTSGILIAMMALNGCVSDAIGTASQAHTGGEPQPDAGPPPQPDAGPPPDAGCTLTQGYWKNHEESWPVASLTLGSRVYSAAALDALLETPPRGDASIILARQLIAAKLNVASGATSTAAIAAADVWLTANAPGHALPYGTSAASLAGAAAVSLAAQLAFYNEGTTGPGHCDD